MTVFLPRGSGSAYQRNITKTLSSPVPEDSREQVRQILKNNNELTDRADSVLSTETATAWGTKQKYGDAFDISKRLILYSINLVPRFRRHSGEIRVTRVCGFLTMHPLKSSIK